jgi:hypothetical protein
MRPGGLNYIYNVLTGYHYKAPKGIDVPKGKSFNPYFDHMIIGMPRVMFFIYIPSNWSTDYSNMMMEPPLPLLKWPLMSVISSTSCKEELVIEDLTNKLDYGCK